MFVLQNHARNAVAFYRNSVLCGSIGSDPQCKIVISDYSYTYGCLTEYSYTLTIPAENMTEYEQGSVWRCEYYGYGSIRSPDVTLNLSSKYNIQIK